MLKYQPPEGSIVMCDFSGFKIPEMIKKRRVVVVRKHRENAGLVAVVPISLTVPNKIQKYHYRLEQEFCMQHFRQAECWVKCDMVYVVSTERLSFQKNKDMGRYAPILDQIVLLGIKEAILCGLGLSE